MSERVNRGRTQPKRARKLRVRVARMARTFDQIAAENLRGLPVYGEEQKNVER